MTKAMDTKDHARKTLAVLDDRGWWGADQPKAIGNVCLEEAIYLAEHGNLDSFREEYDHQNRLNQALYPKVTHGPTLGCLTLWNDTQATEADVRRILQEVIDA